jgi:hypothetical protein
MGSASTVITPRRLLVTAGVLSIGGAILIAVCGAFLSSSYRTALLSFGFSHGAVEFAYRRDILWWMAAAVAAFLYSAIGMGLISLQLTHPFLRAVRVVAVLLSGLLCGPLVVGYVIDLSRSTDGFECILPSPLLIWSPAGVGTASLVLFALLMRSRNVSA